MTSVQLGNRVITESGPPYVIAEIGVNHEGSIEQAKRLIDLAKRGGADAAKFQSYKADTLASKHSPAYWDTSKEPTRSQYQLFRKHDKFGVVEFIELADHCRRVGIDFVSTPFDDDAIEFLDPLVPFYKIASADITNVPFLRKVAAKGKPVVLSTGASTLGEIDAAVDVLRKKGCEDTVLLHCILNYPTDYANAHLRMIAGLQQAFPQLLVGYSDHTRPDENMTALVTACVLGSVVIEKHFTYDKTLPGNDHYHAMDVEDLTCFVTLAKHIHALLGPSDHKAPTPSETLARRNARRSVVLKRDVSAGHRLEAADLTYKRPATGVSPARWDELIGREAARVLRADDILQWEDLTSVEE